MKMGFGVYGSMTMISPSSKAVRQGHAQKYTSKYSSTVLLISWVLSQDLDYSSGVWQFEGYAFVPHGTSGVTIAQIHGATEGATTLQLRATVVT